MAGVTSYPQVTISLLPASVVDAFADRNDLITGQLGAVASATSGALNENIENMNTADLEDLFGAGELYHRILQWQSGNDGYSPLSVIGLDPVAGTAATSTLTFTGTASADGTITVSVVDERQFSVDIAVEDLDDPTAIADKVTAAFTALTNNPPFTTANLAGVVTFTAVDSGTLGNYYSLKTTGTVASVSYAITAWSAGATDPSTTGIFDVIDGLRFTSISWPEAWQGSLTEVTDLLDARFNPSNDILDGTAFTGHSDTFTNDGTFVGSLNTQNLVVAGNNKVTGGLTEGSAIVQPADWTITHFMGVESKRLTPGAPIADDIVALNSPLDSIGGPHTASLPYFNTPLARCPVTASTDLFSNTEQNSLAADGFTTFGVNSAKNAMIMGAVVTTRTTDAAANVNDSFRFFNYVRTGSVCREIFFRTLKATFAQSRLSEGQARPGYSVANEQTIRAELGNIYRTLGSIVLVESGDEAEQFFADNTTVTINKAQRSVTITSLLPIVTQLERINYPLTLTFSITTTGTQITF